MYENGKRVNGYQKKRLHKRKLKNQYVKWYWNFSSWENIEKYFQHKWDKSPEYWKMFYVSEPRKYAKFVTNRTLRNKGNEICYKAKHFDIEDVEIFPQNNNYRRHVEYDWYVW